MLLESCVIGLLFLYIAHANTLFRNYTAVDKR